MTSLIAFDSAVHVLDTDSRGDRACCMQAPIFWMQWLSGENKSG